MYHWSSTIEDYYSRSRNKRSYLYSIV